MRRKAVLLDIGDTLIPASRIARSAQRSAIAYLTTQHLCRPSVNLEDAFRIANQRTQGPSVNHLFSSEDIARQAFSLAGIAPSPACIAAFLSAYRAAVRQALQPDSGLCSVLEMLKHADIGIGVVTDGTTAEQAETLHRIGIIELIDTIVTSQQLCLEKPHPRMFETALGKLGVSQPRRSIMVGDSLPRDIAGAQNVGMKAALMTRFVAPSSDELSCYSPDYVISDLADILPLLG